MTGDSGGAPTSREEKLRAAKEKVAKEKMSLHVSRQVISGWISIPTLFQLKKFKQAKQRGASPSETPPVTESKSSATPVSHSEESEELPVIDFFRQQPDVSTYMYGNFACNNLCSSY